MHKARIVYDFVSQSESEMSVKLGEIVYTDGNSEGGWIYCSRREGNEEGYVPEDFIKLLISEASNKPTVQKSELEKKGDEIPPQTKPEVSNEIETKIEEEPSQPEPSPKSEVNFFQQRETNAPFSPSSAPSSSSTSPINASSFSTSFTPPSSLEKHQPSSQHKRVLSKENPVATSKVYANFRKYLFYLKTTRFIKQKRFRDQKERLNNIKETLDTEETYLGQLSFCINEIKKPLKENKILKDEHFKKLFSDIDQIQFISQDLLRDLKKTAQEPFESGEHLKIAKCFKRISPFFKMYRNYVHNYDESSKVLERARKKNSKFVHFLEGSSKDAPKYCRNYKLEDFLILPIQRIPRYRMLLSNIMKLTHHSHTEFDDLKDSLRIVEEVANFVNRAKKQKLLQKTTIDLNQMLKGTYDSFIQAHRHLIRFSKVQMMSPTLQRKGSSSSDDYGSSSTMNSPTGATTAGGSGNGSNESGVNNIHGGNDENGSGSSSGGHLHFSSYYCYLFNDLVLLVENPENVFKRATSGLRELRKKGTAKKIYFLFLIATTIEDSGELDIKGKEHLNEDVFEPKRILNLRCIMKGMEHVLFIQFEERKDQVEWKCLIEEKIQKIDVEVKKKYPRLGNKLKDFIKQRAMEGMKYINSDGSRVERRHSHEGMTGVKAGGENLQENEEFKNAQQKKKLFDASQFDKKSGYNKKTKTSKANLFGDSFKIKSEYEEKIERIRKLNEEKMKIEKVLKACENELLTAGTNGFQLSMKKEKFVKELESLEKGKLDVLEKYTNVLQKVIKEERFFMKSGLANEFEAFQEIFGQNPIDPEKEIPKKEAPKYQIPKNSIRNR